jgi:hypothetical protein
MIDGQSEQLNRIKKAMIISSDKNELADCKSDLMKKIAMDEKEADAVATSIRDMFMPKLLKVMGIDEDEMPKDFIGKMTEDDENFEEEYTDEDRDDVEIEDEDEEDDFDFSMDDEDHEEDAQIDEDEVGEDEIATIHITVPADKIREVEKALENVLGDTDAQFKDHAMGEDKESPKGEKNMNKEIEARKALRKTILAAVAEDDVEHVVKAESFDHDASEQYKEEGFYETMSGGLKDPDFDAVTYADIEIPNFTKLVDGLRPDLGLSESLKTFKFDGTPSDAEDFELNFNPFDIPSQGNKDLYDGEGPVIPTERKLPMKRTVNSSSLGEFDADAAEEALAFALRKAGVEEEDLGKLTYAEALDLFKAIKTASEDREHYTKDGVMNESNGFVQNTNIKNPDAASNKKEKMATTEDQLHDDKKEEAGQRLSSTHDEYAAMLRKLMKGASYAEKDEEEDDDKDHNKAEDTLKVDDLTIEAEDKMAKEAELYKARLKTAFAMSNKLATAGILPINEVDGFAEGMLSDGLTVTAMIRQTKLMLNSAAANAEKYAAASSSVRTASTGIAFNPSVRGASADLSGAQDIQNALRNLGWSTPKVTGVEE